MSSQNLVDRILSDAKEEAAAIVKAAQEKAAAIVEEARIFSENELKNTQDEVREKVASIQEKKEAAARLDGAKITLSEKRRVIDGIYAVALDRLIHASKEDSVALVKRLLTAYAEDGDEIFFAENFAYAEAVEILPVIKEKNLRVSKARLPLDGGLRLCGKSSDKDLSYGALIAADKEENQSALALEIFA